MRTSTTTAADRYDIVLPLFALPTAAATRITWNGSWVSGGSLLPVWPDERDALVPLARRSDPTMDPYLRASGVPARTEIQSRFATWTAHDTPESVLSRDLISWSPMKTTAYWNSIGFQDIASNATRRAEAQQWLLPAAHPTPGHPYAQIDNWLALDLRIPAARHWLLYGGGASGDDAGASCGTDPNLRAALDLIACGYKGLWVDDVSFSFYHFTWWDQANHVSVNSAPAGITEAEWNDGVSKLLAELRRALPTTAKYTVNIKDGDSGIVFSPRVDTLDQRSPLATEIAAADQVVQEGGAPLDAEHRGGDEGMDGSLVRKLIYADQVHQVGGRLQWEITNSTTNAGSNPAECQGQYDLVTTPWSVGSPSWTTHNAAAEFNLATALIGYAPGDGVGDMCEYPGTGWTGYNTSIGVPTSMRYDDQAAPGSQRTLVRYFSKGEVWINLGDRGAPGTGSKQVTTSKAGVPLGAPAGTAASTTFTLPAGTAKIVKYQ